MTTPADFNAMLRAVLDSAKEEVVLHDDDGDNADTFEELIDKLRFLLPDTLLLAALDLIDRENVIKYTTPWGHTQYEVFGSTATYAVFISPTASRAPAVDYCTCPAFAYSVLKAESHLMCKHVLATRLAEKMSRCVERPVSRENLAAIIVRQCS